MQTAARAAILTVLIAAGMFLLPLTEQPDSWKSPGGPKVVAVYELPETKEYCEPSYVPVAEDTNLFSALGADSAHAGLEETSKTVVLDRDPIRQIRENARPAGLRIQHPRDRQRRIANHFAFQPLERKRPQQPVALIHRRGRCLIRRRLPVRRR